MWYPPNVSNLRRASNEVGAEIVGVEVSSVVWVEVGEDSAITKFLFSGTEISVGKRIEIRVLELILVHRDPVLGLGLRSEEALKD